MEKANIIRRSSSAWASPLHMVPLHLVWIIAVLIQLLPLVDIPSLISKILLHVSLGAPFFKAGSQERSGPGSGGSGGHPKNSSGDTVWTV